MAAQPAGPAAIAGEACEEASSEVREVALEVALVFQ